MNLVEDWKKCYRWLSIQIPVAGAALLAAYDVLPDEYKAAIPHSVLVLIAITFLLGGAVGRVIDQPDKVESKK